MMEYIAKSSNVSGSKECRMREIYIYCRKERTTSGHPPRLSTHFRLRKLSILNRALYGRYGIGDLFFALLTGSVPMSPICDYASIMFMNTRKRNTRREYKRYFSFRILSHVGGDMK